MNPASEDKAKIVVRNATRGIPVHIFAIVIITLVGAILRIHRLDAAELWTDEMTGVIWSGWSFRDYFDFARERGTLHFPLMMWTMKGLIALLGEGEFVYRLVGFIPGTLAIPAIYLMGKELLSREVGLVAAALMALSTTGLFVSQEAWDYGLALLMVILCAHAFFRAWRQGRWRDWTLFLLCGGISFYIHALNAFVLVSLYCVYGLTLFVATIQKEDRKLIWKRAIKPIVVGLILAAICAPGALAVFHKANPDSAPALGRTGIAETFVEPLLTTLRHYAYDRPISVYLLGILAVLGLPMVVKKPRGWLFVIIATLAICVPLYMAQSRDLQYRMRHYTFGLPFALTVMACGVVSLRRLGGLAVPWCRGPEIDSPWPSLLAAGLVLGLPAAKGLQQYYLIRSPQSMLYSNELQGNIEERLIQMPSQIQLYSKGKVTEFREIAALLRRNMGPGDILMLDKAAAGDSTGRGVAFHLNRRFALDLPMEHFWGTPKSTEYDPSGFNVVLSHPNDRFYQSVESASLPGGGTRVFRVSQRYPISEVPGSTQLNFTKIRLTLSNERYKDKPALMLYLKVQHNLSRAVDIASNARERRQSGTSEEAEQLFRESLSIYRTSAGAAGLGQILLSRGNAEEAESLLAFAAEKRINRGDYWHLLGKAYEALGRPDEAVDAYEVAIGTQNLSPWAYADLAKLYQSQGNHEKAHQTFTSLATLVGQPYYLIQAARLRLAEGRIQEALQEGLAVVTEYPDYGLGRVFVAQIYERLGERDKAYPHIVKAASIRPDDANVQAWCIRYHVEFGKIREAESLLKTALQKHPDNELLKNLEKRLQGSAQPSSS